MKRVATCIWKDEPSFCRVLCLFARLSMLVKSRLVCLFVEIPPFSKHLSVSKCIVSAISSLQSSLHRTMPHNPRANARVREYLRGSGTYLYVEIKYRCHLTSNPQYRAAHDWVQRAPKETGICIFIPHCETQAHELEQGETRGATRVKISRRQKIWHDRCSPNRDEEQIEENSL